MAVTNRPSTTRTIGSGSDGLVLKISQDAYLGDAQYTISVDDVQVGGTLTAGALHGNGMNDTITVKGDFASGVHKVTVNFLNDLYHGTAGTDRNLYVDAISLNGKAVTDAAATLWGGGPVDMAFTKSNAFGAPVIYVAGSGSDELVLKISQDAYLGDAQYTISVDDVQVGGTLTAGALHGNGMGDTITVKGDFVSDVHKVTVNFLNDLYHGTAGTDRNLYVDAISLNGKAVTGAAATLWSGGPVDFTFGTPPTDRDDGLVQTFADEFQSFSWNTNAASDWPDEVLPATGTWATHLWWGTGMRAMGPATGNGALEYFSDTEVGVHPFTVVDGVLHIEAAPSFDPARTEGMPYTSGMISSEGTFSQLYGYFEMCAELPAGQGLWSAFWLLGQNHTWPPEIDILEVLGHDMTTLHTTLHTGESGSHTSVGQATIVPDLADGFHTYAVGWRPDTITWFIDGQEIFDAQTPDDMHVPMYVIASLGVGGNWPGAPDATTPFPANMAIDYIRVYQYQDLL